MDFLYKNTKIPELNDIGYYQMDGIQKALNFAKTINKPIDRKYDIYAYWIGDNVSYKHSVVLKSFLATQNLNNATLKIYTDVKISQNPVFDRYRDFKQIEFHLFDAAEEIKNTIFENRFRYTHGIKAHGYNPQFESDFFRLLVMHKYGGMYIDFDVLLLRDMSSLLDYEFVYQWGSYPNIQNMVNGAIMHLIKDSECNKIATENILNRGDNAGLGSLHWASEIYIDIKEKQSDFIVFPAAFFNPEWQQNSDPANCFKNEGTPELFDGSFSWHWHNKWNHTIEEGSKFDILDKILEEKFLKL